MMTSVYIKVSLFFKRKITKNVNVWRLGFIYPYPADTAEFADC